MTGGSGGLKPHPALQRLDLLRRDLIKVMTQLGLQKPEPENMTTEDLQAVHERVSLLSRG